MSLLKSNDFEFFARRIPPGGRRANAALATYREHGAIRFAATREQAKDQLIGEWAEQRGSQPEKSSLILAHTRADVSELNQRARAVLKKRSGLGPDVKVETWREVTRDDGSLAIERGERVFAPGDRAMFLKNDRELGVKNGSLGTVMSVNRASMRVILDATQERQVSFELRNYAAIDHGYAGTVHKAQGTTVDRAFVLATPGMDRHLSYVGMTRHQRKRGSARETTTSRTSKHSRRDSQEFGPRYHAGLRPAPGLRGRGGAFA